MAEFRTLMDAANTQTLHEQTYNYHLSCNSLSENQDIQSPNNGIFLGLFFLLSASWGSEDDDEDGGGSSSCICC